MASIYMPMKQVRRMWYGKILHEIRHECIHSYIYFMFVLFLAVNVNIWLSLEGANENNDSGGLVVYTAKPPG